MRPNIDITHTLAGRVKDYKQVSNAESLTEAYRRVIEAGLEALEHPDES